VKRLAGGVPRTLKDHRTKEAHVYKAIIRAKIESLGRLPADARVVLREYGRLVLDLQRLHLEQDAAVARGRVNVARKIDRRLTPMRTQLMTLEARLEELAARVRPAATTETLLNGMLEDLRRAPVGRGPGAGAP
jgi:hypothetical protein